MENENINARIEALRSNLKIAEMQLHTMKLRGRSFDCVSYWKQCAKKT